MFITGFPAGPLGANCYVFAVDADVDGAPGRDAPPAECVVVDPGQQAAGPLRALVTERGLRPAAVLVTHGHFDHVASAAAVCEEYGVDVYLGGGDVPMLTDQLAALSPELRAGISAMLGPGESLEDLRDMRPARLTPLAGGEHLKVAGLDIDVLAVPGHTPGSVTYRLRTPDVEPDVLFTGDTLFAGTIGRTDLPGGSMDRIIESIAAQLMSLPDDTIAMPGHGAATTVGAERSGNPFLARLR